MLIPAALARLTNSIEFTFAGSSHQRMKPPCGRDRPIPFGKVVGLNQVMFFQH
jgi:tetrahydromethanopterin S-methyltransferase subunit G